MITVVDSNPYVHNIIQELKFEFEFECNIFYEITSKLYEEIAKASAIIYILEFYLQNGTGMDVARKISEIDKNAIIIFISNDYQPLQFVGDIGFMRCSFVHKGFNFKEKLKEVLIKAIETVNEEEQILWVEKIKNSKKCRIKTTVKEFEQVITLKELEETHGLIKVSRTRLISFRSMRN